MSVSHITGPRARTMVSATMYWARSPSMVATVVATASAAALSA